MPEVKATADLQFRPVGDGFSYMTGELVGVEAEKLADVLDACRKIGTIFKMLVPEAKREWWTEEKGLTLTTVNKQVAIDEIVEEVKVQLAQAKWNLTSQQVKALRSGFPTGIVSATDGSVFPPLVENGNGAGGAQGLSFDVEAPAVSDSCYYSMPDGTVKCCRSVTMTMNKQPVLLAAQGVEDGRIDVVMTVHFTVQE